MDLTPQKTLKRAWFKHLQPGGPEGTSLEQNPGVYVNLMKIMDFPSFPKFRVSLTFANLHGKVEKVIK